MNYLKIKYSFNSNYRFVRTKLKSSHHIAQDFPTRSCQKIALSGSPWKKHDSN